MRLRLIAALVVLMVAVGVAAEQLLTTGVGSATATAAADAPPLTDLELWLKADAITGLNDGDDVATWADSSSNAYDATEGTSKPIYKTNILNGKPVVRFVRANSDRLTIASGFHAESNNKTGLTVIVVGTTITVAANYFTLTNGTGSNNRVTVGQSTTERVSITAGRDSATGSLLSNNNVQPLGTFKLISIIADYAGADQVELFVNGTNAGRSGGTIASNPGTIPGGPGNTSATNANGNRIGANIALTQFLDGDIAEILFYSVAVSSADHTTIKSYLCGKYGFTCS